METRISNSIAKTPAIEEAETILRSCVHCGFCTATCTTYQLLGNELDGPRGRIYLIKQMLETGQASSETREHLDRCLLCRACESTCPSGVH
jgi:glycolate oxidase iron-sulfur subunit